MMAPPIRILITNPATALPDIPLRADLEASLSGLDSLLDSVVVGTVS